MPASEQAKANRRAREKIKKKRKRDRLRAERLAAAGAMLMSKTSASYRQIRFGIAPEMSKRELRAVLAQAVRNTAVGDGA